MKTQVLTLVAFFLLLYSTTFGQTKKDLNIDFMLRGYIYAQSSIEDTLAAGGFSDSDNLAKKVSDRFDFSETGFFLKIDTNKTVLINDKYNGYKLFIVNKSDSLIRLEGSDSRLSVIAEVFVKGEWKPIEYLPSSWCGNSYHSVYLKQNEYWEFDVPKFSGKIKTKLRYRLLLDNGKFIYSNEVPTSINKGQLKSKEGHSPNGVMDPYND
ncbi:MAG: hypothetical protein JWM14_1457 [Chitinophagaceae bacterium]|nr:hypothetical protein [Chitinophagaceae bacterium]